MATKILAEGWTTLLLGYICIIDNRCIKCPVTRLWQTLSIPLVNKCTSAESQKSDFNKDFVLISGAVISMVNIYLA